jgi:uncharacterized protein (DUF302 family)
MSYSFSQITNLNYDEAITKVTEELKKEGFGVLTQIDVQNTLKQKLDKDFRRYMILGACNPPFAYQALTTELEIGVMLPCNVIVYENPDGKATVAAVDPMKTISSVGNPKLKPIAKEITVRLKKVIEAMR